MLRFSGNWTEQVPGLELSQDVEMLVIEGRVRSREGRARVLDGCERGRRDQSVQHVRAGTVAQNPAPQRRG